MFGRKWGNQWRALAACSLALAVACENPGPEWNTIEGGGAAGGAARVHAPRELVGDPVRWSAHPASESCGAEAASSEETCEGRMSGVYGIEVGVDVQWSDENNPNEPAFDPGRGTLRALLIAELAGLCPGDTEGELVTRVCDLQLPPLYSKATGEIVQLAVPRAAWEQSSMPELTARVRSMSREEPGFEIVSPMIAMLGIELASSDAAWPSHDDTASVSCGEDRSGADCFPDQDDDEFPGITLRTVLSGPTPSEAPSRKGGWHYAPLPSELSFPLAGYGASTLFAGLRTKIGGTYGVGSDCNGGDGAAEAGDLELRVFDCAMVDGTACTVGDAAIVDRHMPVFHASGGTSRVIRLTDSGEGVSCADVREALAAGGPDDMDDR
jgi:hypothetical protein